MFREVAKDSPEAVTLPGFSLVCAGWDSRDYRGSGSTSIQRRNRILPRHIADFPVNGDCGQPIESIADRAGTLLPVDVLRHELPSNITDSWLIFIKNISTKVSTFTVSLLTIDCHSCAISSIADRESERVSFMSYGIGYFDPETCRVEPMQNPFGPKVLTMCPV